MDTIAEAQVENLTDNLYNYKDRLPIPPLGMVDDQINVAYCGLDSALTTYQNFSSPHDCQILKLGIISPCEKSTGKRGKILSAHCKTPLEALYLWRQGTYPSDSFLWLED